MEHLKFGNPKNKVGLFLKHLARAGVGVSPAPTQVNVNYLAGYPRQANGQMDVYHGQIISWLSAALLQCQPCGCGCGHDQLLQTYTQPPVFKGDRVTMSLQRKQMEESRFGYQVGAIKAWNALQCLRANLG